MSRGMLLVVVTVAAAGLAACTPSPVAFPSPTPTPDAATPPARPDMNRVDTATAEAVAMYFLGLYPYVYATRDLTEWFTVRQVPLAARPILSVIRTPTRPSN